MERPTKRKAFNFLRSYFDVVNELQNDADKLDFLMAVINKQFLDEEPKDLNFVVNLCYQSQKHAVESSVKGWKRVSNTDLIGNPMTNPTTNPMTNPSSNPPTNPKEVEEEVEVEEKVKVNKFTPPTADDVKAYCLSRNNDVNVNKFIDFYQSKGWMVGKTKMKDWKACIRTWEKDSIESPKQQIDPLVERAKKLIEQHGIK